MKRRHGLRRVSKKMAAQLDEYYVLRDEFLTTHRTCEAACSRECQQPKPRTATQVHHKARRGKNLLRVETWMAVCLWCHNWIEEHPKESRERGFLLPRW